MKLWSIQVLRFVAALLVVYQHSAGNAFRYPGLIAGRAGVDIFFVISGFIITRTAKGLSAPEFIVRRAQRILPLYIVTSAIWVLFVAITGGVLTWRQMVATWLFWPATNVMTSPVVPVGWSLCFEVLFYCAFALAIWRSRALWLIGATFLGALVTRHGPALQFLGNPMILLFLVGVGLAYAPRWRPAIYALPVGVLMLFACTLFVVGPRMCMADDLLEGLPGCLSADGMGLPAVLIVWGTLQLNAGPSVFTYLGDASYALYLVHYPVAVGAAYVAWRYGHWPPVAVCLFAMAACVLACWPVHEFVEKPILARLRRWGRRQRLQPAAALAVNADLAPPR